MRDASEAAPSLAAAAMRDGRFALARSFRLHRPRGAFCGRGYCQQCPVLVDGGSQELACLTPAGPGAVPKTPRARFDPLRVAGWITERWPPWFYETRFLRPRFLRQARLDALRRLSAAHPLPRRAPAPPGGSREETCAVLVVGGGAAGLAAAAVLAEAGGDVLLVEAEALGGSARFVPGSADGLGEAIGRLRRAGARVLERTTFLGLYPGEGIGGAVGPDGPLAIRFERLVVATGAYDRPLAVPGADLPGVIGLRGFERLAHDGAFRERLAVGVYAGPEEAERALRAADAAGLAPAFLAGPTALPMSGALARVRGRRRVRGIELDPGGRLLCDVLVLGFTQPTFELQVQAGATPRLAGEPAVIVADGRTTVPTLVVGEAAGALTVDDAARQAEGAARAWLAGEAPPPPVEPRTLPVGPPHPDALVCWCEDVRVRDVRRAVAEGFTDIELVKRRSGATTGPCQGKLCLADVCAVLRAEGVPVRLPTVRPPLRPVALSELAGAPDG